MTDTPAGRRSGDTASAVSGETAASRRPQHYKNGRAFEYRTRLDLQENGYQVFRLAGSKTKVDLFAAKPGQVLVIQCKRHGALPPAEWNALIDIALIFGGVPILARGGRGHHYYQLDRKKTQRGPQPMTPFVIDAAA